MIFKVALSNLKKYQGHRENVYLNNYTILLIIVYSFKYWYKKQYLIVNCPKIITVIFFFFIKAGQGMGTGWNVSKSETRCKGLSPMAQVNCCLAGLPDMVQCGQDKNTPV